MWSRVVPIAALALGSMSLLACTTDKPTANSTESSSSAPATTSTTATTAPPTTVDPIVPAGSADDAASAFISAWRNGDQAAASQIATPAAVQAAFGAGSPGHIENRGCNSPPANGPVLCVYRTTPGELQIRVQPRPDGWYVDQAILSPA